MSEELQYPPGWTRAWRQKDGASAGFKTQPEDFCVTELSNIAFSDEGEHLYLYVEKRDQNTAWVADRLADTFTLSRREVGFAGLKDRRSVSRQWFSVPSSLSAQSVKLDIDGVQLIESRRHSVKLRRGDHLGNRFAIRLRSVEGDKSALEARLQQLATIGFPNYFGSQRFGRAGDNVDRGVALALRHRLKLHSNRGIYLSAMRSWLFNRFLSDRIDAGDWTQIAEHAESSGPLWGRGRLANDTQFSAAEAMLSEQYAQLCDVLEHNGLAQERRLLCQKPDALQWHWQDGDLCLQFALPSGTYATSLLDELSELREPEFQRDANPMLE